MRFVCDSCRAQHSISDEKVGSSGAKVRCTTCGHVNWVLREGEASPVAKEGKGQMTQVWKHPLMTHSGESTIVEKTEGPPNALSHISEDDIGAALDEVLKSRPNAVPEDANNDLESTRIMSSAALSELSPQRLTESEAEERSSSSPWYVAIDNKQVGPIDLEALKGHWERGEIGADSLCWKNGMANWVPLSDLPELALVLAPRRPKPVIVTSSVATSESVFSSGNSVQAPAKQVAATLSAPVSSEWKPSAASALASLVKEEVQNFASKSSTTGAEEGAALESKLPEELSSTRPPPPLISPFPASTGYPSYAAPAPSGNRALMVGVTLMGVVLLVLVVLVGIIALRPSMQGLTPGLAQEPPGTQPPKASPAQEPANEERKFSPVVAKETETKPTVAEKQVTVTLEPVKDVETEEAIATTKTRSKETEKRQRTKEDKLVVSDAPPAPLERPRVISEPSGDEFDKVFGVENRAPVEGAKREKQPPKTVYVPPAPGGGEGVMDRLGQSDINGVVLANISSIRRCVEEQHKRSPGVKGTLTMQWTVQTSGKTTNVVAVTEDLRSEYITSCIGGLVKGWTFPRHKIQGEPIKFPFKF